MDALDILAGMPDTGAHGVLGLTKAKALIEALAAAGYAIVAMKPVESHPPDLPPVKPPVFYDPPPVLEGDDIPR